MTDETAKSETEEQAEVDVTRSRVAPRREMTGPQLTTHQQVAQQLEAAQAAVDAAPAAEETTDKV